MKSFGYLFATAVLVLCSCYFPVQYTYKINLKSGTIEVVYEDLRTSEEIDSAIFKDLSDLTQNMDYHDSIFNTNYYAVVSRKLYQKDSTLCGKFKYKIRNRDSTNSILQLLKSITGSDEEGDLSWHATNKEIFLFVNKDAEYRLKASNGTLIQTELSQISVWSFSDTLFSFTFSLDTCCPGISLLPSYLSKNPSKLKK